MKLLLKVLVLGGLFGLVFSGGAAGFVIVDEAHWWPGPIAPRPLPPPHLPRPIPPRPHVFSPLEVSELKVNTRINDQVAVTELAEEFYNPNPVRLEGTFVFPIPKGAHLDNFTMEIDGKQVQAELLSAEKARRIYEDIVRKLKDPALLEYAGRDVFKARIFPIEPNSTKRIKLTYTQLLKLDDGLASYVLPLSTEKFSARPVRNVSVRVDLETRQPLKSIYSPSHSVEIKRHGPNRATVGYEAAQAQSDNDFALYFAPKKDEMGVNLLACRRAGEDGYFMLLASPGMDVKEKQIVQKDITFVLDTSGSMAGKKLEQAKKALAFCIENLNSGDRFEIIRFSTETESLFDRPVEANQQNRSRAAEFVKDLKATGGTAIDDALRKALELQGEFAGRRSQDEEQKAEPGRTSGHDGRPYVVVFLTDGRPTVGTTDEDEIVADVKRRHAGRTRIFCFGIGTDVNTHLLDRITEETRAFSQYVLPDEDLELKVSSFFSKIKEPVLANPTLRFTGDIRITKLYPSPLPDLFKGEQLVLVGRYSGRGDFAAVLEGTVNGQTKKFTYDVKFPEESSDNEFIPRLWATRRVGYLLDEIRLHGDNSELREEVTELARKYGIVTPYTAYLIMEDETRRDVPMQSRSLPALEQDREARQAAESSWNEYKAETLGEKAIGGARYGLMLKTADAAAPALAGSAVEANRSLGIAAAPATSSANSIAPMVTAPRARTSRERVVQYAQETRFVSGKSFFENNNQWIDSEVQKHPKANRVRIQFDSPEYYSFIAKHSPALSWVALGQNVQFVLEGTVYEIYEK